MKIGAFQRAIIKCCSNYIIVMIQTDPLEISGGMLSAVDIVAQQLNGCHWLSDHDDDKNYTIKNSLHI